MLFERIIFFLHLVNCQLQINLYLTEWLSEDENLQHDCLHVPAYIKNESDPYQIISYCMGELPSKFKIKENHIDQKLTFDELSKQNITNQQLYLWSAPIDLIENYQQYLNQLQNSEKTLLATRIFYNCTLPYFGPKCQYILHDHKSYHLSLDEIIHDYYYYNRYQPTLFTCYIHLECNRGTSPSCLDWTEICDGKVDCINGRYDEEHCWQLEIHQCNDNEYQCFNGQCIPEAFYRDYNSIPDCFDQSDEIDIYQLAYTRHDIFMAEPTFKLEDISCVKTNNMQVYPSFLTSSCIAERHKLLSLAMFSIKPNSISDECWSAIKCIIHMPSSQSSICMMLCDDGLCEEIINKTCPDIIYVPAFPLFFGHIYFAYDKNKYIYMVDFPSEPTYVCYNDQLLRVPDDNKNFRLSDNKTCRLFEDSQGDISQMYITWLETFIPLLYKWLYKKTVSIYNNSAFLNRSMMYQCMNWPKYISKSRLYDGVEDCPENDDEELPISNEACSTKNNRNFFKCQTTNKCISRNFVGDKICHCTIDDVYCDDEHFDVSYARNTISFQTICDRFIHLITNSTEDQNETDETNCEQWPLIHIYNHCDGYWHNLNGSDELKCDLSPLLNCSANNHICVSVKTNELMCLPIEKANDGIIDCLGAADEPILCRRNKYYGNYQTFLCEKDDNQYCINVADICNGYVDCPHKEDQRACKSSDIIKHNSYEGICKLNYELYGSDIAKVLCRYFSNIGHRWRIYFTLDQRQNSIQQNVKLESSRQLPQQSIQSYQQRCHRGLDLQVWLDKKNNLTTNICLCPPSFYGNICQYQNQRVSLTLQFLVSPDSVQTPFIIIISLIDNTNERIIHSYEQFIYLSLKYCQRKFNIYLLYSTKPKNEMKHYLIHIDIYEKITFKYRGSIIKSFYFSFLPVHRLAFQINIPRAYIHIEDCSDNECINGKCIRYFNDPNNKTFCQCNSGWSGRYCTIKYDCMCSSDSLCIDKLANNRSLCICPLNKMGPRCLINDNICQNNKTITCFNHGQCIPLDEYRTSTKKFICICPKGFTGDQCEIVRTKLIISFDRNIILPSSIFVHFIEVKGNALPIRTTTLKMIPFEQNSIIVYWSLPFHIAFVELLNKTYYLILMQKIHKQSSRIERRIYSSDRCFHINELFNKTIANSSLIRRIKYYHLPCQSKSLELSCFYDEHHLCLCQQIDQQRVANCFEFEHNMNLNCSGQNVCLNGGQCFQENTDCPRISICTCPVCFYGAQCQFSTSGFSLSLDAILGYHILPKVNILNQPRAVLISSILSLIIIVGGIINGILSLMTFKNKNTRESGCGIYLLSSSIMTLLIMIIFLLKFLILLLSQIGLIQNRLFLTIQCHSIDFLLRFSLTMDQWLTAFVAIERAFIIIKGINFNKRKSKLVAKWIITGFVLLIFVTNISDPIYRSLFEENDDEEKRIWCIVNYPSAIRTINLIINIFHFIVPFIINLLSAITIIVMSSRQQAALQRQQKYKKILNEQIEKHKNLLIGPCVLILLGIPRLIISFTSGCMKSSSDSWLFLVGYFISLIPPVSTFILFVLPSTTYKQAFRKAIGQYQNMITRRS